MQLSSIPNKYPIPWGNAAGSAYINPIPTGSLAGTGFASLTDGFPPLNSVPEAAGGIPPHIQDWNGILNQITLWQRWQQAGAPITYDAAFQTAVGGYPKGAVVTSTAGGGAYWLSTTDNNTTNPEANGAGWAPMLLGESDFALDTGAVNALVVPLATGTFTCPNGTIIAARAKVANNGPSTLTVGGQTWGILQGGATLSGGEILANWPYYFMVDNGTVHMIGSGAGAVNVGAATGASHAIPLSQAQTAFAAVGGTPSQTFFANLSGAAGQGQIGAGSLGENTAYLYNGPVDWGLFSQSGGILISYTRSTSAVQVGGGAPVSVANAVSAGQATTYAQSVGVSTLHNNTDSRSFGVTYTNSTAKLMPISVWAHNPSSATLGAMSCYVDGAQISQTDVGGGDDWTAVFFVPEGATYEVSSGGVGLNLMSWTEWY